VCNGFVVAAEQVVRKGAKEQGKKMREENKEKNERR